MSIDKTKFHKEIIGPYTGQHFTIRKVRLKELMISLGSLPLAASSTVQDILESLKEKAQTGDSNTEEKITRFYATRGVVLPKLWFDDEAQCPEGQIYYLDLGSDLDYVVAQIIEYSNEMGGLKEFDNFFRGAGAGNSGPDSEAIQPAPVEAVAEKDIQ